MIQVEGRRRGLLDCEDRIVLVRAWNEADARRRCQKEFDRYGRPYLGATNLLVRWRFEDVTDVYSLAPFRMDDPVIEVYSKPRRRRLRPGDVWRPRR